MMRITISRCWCAAFAVLAACGCSSKGNDVAAPANSASNPAEGKAPGMMSPAQQQQMIQERMEQARNRSGAGDANSSGRPMTLNTYRTMMDHMNAKQKIEYARKHPNISVAPSAQ